MLDFETPSDFVRTYPMSREWMTLLIRRMDAVAFVYRLAATLSTGFDGLRSCMEFHAGGASMPSSPSTTAATLACALRHGPAQALSLRPATGRSGVPLHPPLRCRSNPGSQRLRGEVDYDVLPEMKPL